MESVLDLSHRRNIRVNWKAKLQTLIIWRGFVTDGELKLGVWGSWIFYYVLGRCHEFSGSCSCLAVS